MARKAKAKTPPADNVPKRNPVAALIEEIRADPPHEMLAAADGYYCFNQRDRWFGQRLEVAEGWHIAGEWALHVRGHSPFELVRRGHPLFPRHD